MRARERVSSASHQILTLLTSTKVEVREPTCVFEIFYIEQEPCNFEAEVKKKGGFRVCFFYFLLLLVPPMSVFKAGECLERFITI